MDNKIQFVMTVKATYSTSTGTLDNTMKLIEDVKRYAKERLAYQGPTACPCEDINVVTKIGFLPT